MRLLEKQYGSPHKLVSSYRKEIKQMTKIKPGDAAACRRLFTFLIKCQSSEYGSQNPLHTPDVICMILSKISGYLQDRWKRNVQKIRKAQISGEAVGQYEKKQLKQ